MKKIYALLLLQLIWGGGVKAQLSPCDSAHLDSSLDLSGAIFNNIHIDTISYAKSPLPLLFRDVKYKDDAYSKPPGCTGPASDQCLNDGSALVAYVYYPQDHDYSACLLYPMVFAHAGGFAECSSLDQTGINNMAMFLAQRGFVVFNVEYRRGIMLDSANLSYTSAQQDIAPYRAVQDLEGFIRSMVKRERHKSSFTDYWHIDTNNIIVGGMSAGAVAAINTAWYTDSMRYALYAPPIASGNIQYVLGSPAVDFYYGEPDFDFHTYYQPKIKAVFGLWGAAQIPFAGYKNYNDQPAFFAGAHLTPAIFFHGFEDVTFPLINRMGFTQYVNLSPGTDTQFNSVNFCIRNDLGPFKVDTNSTKNDLINGSSYNMYIVLNAYGKTCEIYVDCSMGHGLDADGPGYGSNFGTSDTSQVQTELYMSVRIAVFMQKQFHPPASYGNKIFVDCENKSVKCTTNTYCGNRSCGTEKIFP